MQNNKRYNNTNPTNRNKSQNPRNSSYYKSKVKKSGRGSFSFYDTAKKRQMNSYLRAIAVLTVCMTAVTGFIFLGIFLKNVVAKGNLIDPDSIQPMDNMLESAETAADINVLAATPVSDDIISPGFEDESGENGVYAIDDPDDISQIYNSYNGVYLDIQKLADIDDLQSFIDNIKLKGINAVNIDIKRGDGVIPINLNNQMAEVVGAVNNNENLPVESVLGLLHENNLYVSGTIACFKDDLASTMYPDYALRQVSDNMRWSDSTGNHWLNAYSDGAREYIKALAVESASLGFDEIVLSYFFFPNLSNPNDLSYNSNGVSKPDIIKTFIVDVRASVENISEQVKVGVQLPLTYFLTAPHETTGINPISLKEACDFFVTTFAPADIPANISINNKVLQNATSQPYESVKLLCEHFSNYTQIMMFRPTLQAYTASDGIKYNEERIMAQKQALYEANIKTWQLVNFDNEY